jgi:prolipoprotein diacylglyceryltransferase
MFYPTQLYETVSMVLLVFLLVAFQPFRRHDGQVLVLLMVGYAAHRFLNEAIRIEPTYTISGIDFGLTLSQWISVLILLAAIGLEIYLRLTRPKLPPGPQPLGAKAV